MTWKAEDPQGNEAAKVKYDIVQYTRGVVLDLGCGANKAFPHFIGVDSGKDTQLFGVAMKPDVVDDCATLSRFEPGQCDAVFSSHLLEHIEDTAGALAAWWNVIKVGGYLILYLPHRDLYPRIGQPGSNPDHKHDFAPEDIELAMIRAGAFFDLLVQEVRGDTMEYSFLQVFRKRGDEQRTYPFQHARPAKTACVVRYGGYGDSLQAANILPELKRQGYHVTFMTAPRGYDILKHDPHIDAWFIQDDDQVPNPELPEFWLVQSKRFDKFVNLSESIEGTLLAMAGRANHAWPDSVRRRELGKNYLEWTAQLAEVAYRSEARFYPTPREVDKARSLLANTRNALAGALPIPMRARDRFNIVWALSGSSMHKCYPHQDDVIANVLANMPEAVVYLVGDPLSKILEAGWEDVPTVVCLSGELPIRDTLTLALQADCVVGPETGILNAVAFEPMGKVIMLSHSSPENLTKHWVNTDTLTPLATSCYPCHRLHIGMAFCREHKETGTAMCQYDIAPIRPFEAIWGHYQTWRVRNMKVSAA